jgi:Aerotolerance regulator N-terminal/von Willebrand factor type A domain
MNFLTPLFLLGGLAVALPIVFHLVRRSSREKMVFSSLMFLKPTLPRMTRRNRLEHIFLLFLRCLAICILALGFARPFIQKQTANGATTRTGSRIVMLVDASASMKREGVWRAALEKAEALLKETSSADQVAIYVFNDQIHSVLSFEQWAAMGVGERPTLAAQRIAENKPTWHSTHLGNALIAAAEALEDADKSEQFVGHRRIIVVTDLQEGSRLDGIQGYDWPRGVEVAVETVKARRPTNAGLQWVMDVENSARTTTDAGVRLRVSNSSDAQREQFQIKWGGINAPSLDAYVPPGQSRIVQAPKLPDGSTGDKIVLSGDDNDFDNTVYLVQPKAEQINVLFLGNDSEKNPEQSLYYLKRAFQTTPGRAVHVNTLNTGGPSVASVLGTNQLVILSGALSEDGISGVQQFITNGGTALFVMNDAASATQLGQLAGATGVAAYEAPASDYSMFSQLDFEHPLLAPFADPRFSDFTKIRVWKHRTLALDKLPDARVIVRFDNGDPAIVEIPAGRGKLFLLTFSWKPSDSQLALSSKFVPLLYSILEQAGGNTGQPAQYRVGDPVNLASFVAQYGASRLELSKPDGTRVQLQAGETRFLQTDQPGIYEVFANSGPAVPISKFAVNLDEAESRTAPLPVEELERLALPVKPSGIESAVQAQQTRKLHDADLEGRQKLWRWLIVAALVVLMVETWLAGRITRRSSTRVEAAA